jgi:hypothetical protein
MPILIKAKTKQRRTFFVSRATSSVRSDLASCHPFFFHKPIPSRRRRKTKRIASHHKAMMAGQNVDEKMATSNLDGLTRLVDDIDLNSEGYNASVADISTTVRPIRDSLQTRTSILQDGTMQECLPLLACTEESLQHSLTSTASGIPRLEREKHVEYLRRSVGKLPAAYVAVDASRPWVLYWVLAGLCLLGEDVQPYKERCGMMWCTASSGVGADNDVLIRVVRTLTPMQNPGGGYGGGNGQLSHCAPTYAAILSLAMVGDSKSWELIDRRGL